MKVRIKFSKEGPVKFVGHLDTMRYFQKAIRRANLPVAFSGGYSPHMIMSFAAPLGVGTESLGEYFDLELAETVPTSEITRRLDAVMVEGVHVLSTRQVEDGKAGKAMSLVAAADYYVEFRPGKEPEISWKDKINDFLAQPEITVMKKTKRSEKEIDIRPFIYKMELQGDKIFMMLASASANYTKPELVTDTFFSWLGIELPEFAYSIKRLEVYADKGTEEEHKFVTLEPVGEKSSLGNIYVGQIENIAANIGAAFVQISAGEKCYLQLSDAPNAIYASVKKGDRPLKAGDEILVQISREAMKGKLPAVTTNLNFTGKYLVLTTGDKKFGLSSKLSNDDRSRISKWMEAEVNRPE